MRLTRRMFFHCSAVVAARPSDYDCGVVLASFENGEDYLVSWPDAGRLLLVWREDAKSPRDSRPSRLWTER